MNWAIIASLLLAPAPVDPSPAPTSQAAASFFHTGRSLRQDCSREDDLSLGRCIGYIDSVLDSLFFKDTFADVRRTCVSDRVTNESLRALILRALVKEADAGQLPAFIYVQEAIAATHGCSASVPAR